MSRLIKVIDFNVTSHVVIESEFLLLVKVYFNQPPLRACNINGGAFVPPLRCSS